MASNDDRLYFRAGETMVDRVESYQERGDFDDRSKAVRNLIEVGLRETDSPLVYRLKDEVVEWVGLLGIAAVIVFVGGATTPVLDVGEAGLFAVGLAVTAVVLLGGYELLRLLLGANELGDMVRAWAGRLLARTGGENA